MIESFLNTVARLREQFDNGIAFTDKAMDLPDERDYLAGSPKIGVLPSRVDLYAKAHRIGYKPRKQTKGSCTAYSEIYRAEIENTIEHGKKIILDPELQWKYQEATGASRDRGDFIQNAKKQFHKHPQGYPQTEYRRLSGGHYDAMKWLALQRPINTGVYWRWLPDKRMSNYEWMKRTGVYIPGEGKALGAHAILYTGYENGDFKFLESELTPNLSGNNKDGEFVMSLEDYYRAMSCYISMDALDK